MKDTLSILLLLILTCASLIGGGFFFGIRYERMLLLKPIAKAMEQTCTECNEEGKKEGYKTGIKTCDDVIDSINNQGRY